MTKKGKEIVKNALSNFLKVEGGTGHQEKRHSLNLQTSTCPCARYFAVKF